jgi:hypothetical protein
MFILEQDVDEIYVFLNPSRNSIALFTIDGATSAGMDAWVPTMTLIREFATSTLNDDSVTFVPSINAIQQRIFSLGFGPR